MQFDITEESGERLDGIGKRTSAATRAHVVRRALGLYQRILELIEAGGSIYLEEKNGEKYKLIFTDSK